MSKQDGTRVKKGTFRDDGGARMRMRRTEEERRRLGDGGSSDKEGSRWRAAAFDRYGVFLSLL